MATRERTEERVERTETPSDYKPRLKEQYNNELRAQLKDELDISMMKVPRLQKITLNMGVGEAKNDAKQLDSAAEELTIIAGQRAQIRRARKSIAGFKIREGMPIGAKVTLRGDRMWEFLDRLISIALPRIATFAGLSPRSFDGRGNYSLGFASSSIFPEINYDDVSQIRGSTSRSRPRRDGRRRRLALLRALGFPFAGEAEEQQ
jgi:large subunit ribosomal protein L5